MKVEILFSVPCSFLYKEAYCSLIGLNYHTKSNLEALTKGGVAFALITAVTSIPVIGPIISLSMMGYGAVDGIYGYAFGKELLTGRELSEEEKILKGLLGVLYAGMLSMTAYNGLVNLKKQRAANKKAVQSEKVVGPEKPQVLEGTKNGKNYKLDKSTGKHSYKKFRSSNKFNFSSDAKDHLANSQGLVRNKGQGIVGGHNMDAFYGELKAQGFDIDDCIINRTPHPTFEGIYEIKYQIPALDNKGNILPNKYKNISRPKTVYDPNIFSNDEIYRLGTEAMQGGKVNGYIVEGFASNGLKFTGYIDDIAGEITNFFPTLR